jgi:hypothetical protein
MMKFNIILQYFNYDNDNLVCYDENNEKNRAFVFISKKDGSITNKVKIPFKKNISLLSKSQNGILFTTVGPSHYRTIIPFKGNWYLVEFSSDTVYIFLPDYNLCPFLVRTPSIQSMEN